MTRGHREPLLRGLRGEGLEIGAYHSPLAVPDGVRVRYVDRFTPEESAAYFPESSNGDVVRPDYIATADDLSPVADASQDFVMTSHLLEHVADPIRALREWHRVLRPGGQVVLILPDRRDTFDRMRPGTTLEHLIADHQATPERRDVRDRVHYEEWARLVNGLEDDAQVAAWSELLQEARYPIHFHCWTLADLVELAAWLSSIGAGFEVERTVESREFGEFGLTLRRT